MAEFGGGSLEKFSPRRRVEKEIAHFDDRPDVPCGRLRLIDYPAAVKDFIGDLLLLCAAQKAGVRNGADTGQGFPAEPHRADAKEVLVALELAGGVRGEGQRKLLHGNSAAVVDDADQLPPPG